MYRKQLGLGGLYVTEITEVRKHYINPEFQTFPSCILLQSKTCFQREATNVTLTGQAEFQIFEIIANTDQISERCLVYKFNIGKNCKDTFTLHGQQLPKTETQIPPWKLLWYRSMVLDGLQRGRKWHLSS